MDPQRPAQATDSLITTTHGLGHRALPHLHPGATTKGLTESTPSPERGSHTRSGHRKPLAWGGRYNPVHTPVTPSHHARERLPGSGHSEGPVRAHLDAALACQLHGRVIVAAAQQVLHHHAVHALPLPHAGCRRLVTAVLLEVLNPALAQLGALILRLDGLHRLCQSQALRISGCPLDRPWDCHRTPTWTAHRTPTWTTHQTSTGLPPGPPGPQKAGQQGGQSGQQAPGPHRRGGEELLFPRRR